MYQNFIFPYLYDAQQCAWKRPPTTRPSIFHGIMKNQRLPVQFYAPDDEWCVARNMLNFI